MAKIYLLSLFLLVIFSSQTMAKTSISAIAMQKVKLSAADLRQICDSVAISCDENNIGLWQLKNAKDQIYYLLDGKPQIIKLKKNATTYQLQDHWDFENYQHQNQQPSDQMLMENGMSIYPAIYPLNQTQHAIAIVNTWFTGYSGGGSSEKFADFVQLKANGQYEIALKNIPFSYSKMIRACFSEAEYRSSPHCHDEQWGILTIKFEDKIAQPFYQWQLNYIDYSWDAFKTKDSTRIETHQRSVLPFDFK